MSLKKLNNANDRDCDEFAKLQGNLISCQIFAKRASRIKTDKSFVCFCPRLDLNFYDRHNSCADLHLSV